MDDIDNGDTELPDRYRKPSPDKFVLESVYPVIVPPVFAGGVQVNTKCEFVILTLTFVIVGAVGLLGINGVA